MGKDKGHLVVTNDPNDDVAIRVEHVSKSFRLPHNKQNSIKGNLVNLVSRGDRTYETQEVLKDVSFEIKKGDFFGIVGRNGSGKSTLLKMLAGIYTPTKGKIIVNGSLTPFIELGVGFNMELTGRENVYMNGALLGFNDKEVDAMYDDIVKFAELEKFMDQRLKNYSSGMQVRLAFSIAIRAESDILLLDEVLAVGDEAFQQKCFDYFDMLKRNGQSVVLVTHDMSAVQRFCTKVMLIHEGRILQIGTPRLIASLYTKKNDEVIDGNASRSSVVGNIKVQLRRGSDNKVVTVFSPGQNLKICVKWKILEVVNIGIALHKADGTYIFGTNKAVDSTAHAEYSVKLDIAKGSYFIMVYLFDKNGDEIGHEENMFPFRIRGDVDWGGMVKLKGEWK